MWASIILGSMIGYSFTMTIIEQVRIARLRKQMDRFTEWGLMHLTEDHR